MPPSIPHTRLPVLKCALTSYQPTASLAVRTFSSTPTSHAIQTPPESPHYITLPTPAQSSEPKLPPIRGHLPVPREVFPRYQKQKQLSPKYLPKTYPLSAAEARGDAPRTAHESWKRRMAASRRTGLAEGIQGLWTRKVEREAREKTVSQRKANRNRYAALRAPERADEVLVRPSVRRSTAVNTTVLRDPARQERAAESAVRTAAITQFKSESRRDALMELYVASKKFIVDESALEVEVDKLFTEDYFPKGGSATGDPHPENIWDFSGAPPTVRSMLLGIARAGTRNAETDDSQTTTARQKVLAETLTGGKIPAY